MAMKPADNSGARNLDPTPEAVFAIYHWHDDYAAQSGGVMDFFDGLSYPRQTYCREAVERIYAAHQSHRYERVE